MFGLGAGEILVILVLALIFIGPKKLPELAKSLGKGLREFQKAKDGVLNELNQPSDTTGQKNTSEKIPEKESLVEVVDKH